MPRYVTKPDSRRILTGISKPAQAYWETSPQPLPAPTVFPSEPVHTGLFDHQGNPIFKAPDPIGFLSFE